MAGAAYPEWRWQAARGESPVERRRNRRQPQALSAWLCFRADGNEFGNLTHDISPDGASFNAWHQVAVGDGVLICFQFSEGQFECKGQIRWVRTLPNGERRFGVRFVDLLDEERQVLEDQLQRDGRSGVVV